MKPKQLKPAKDDPRTAKVRQDMGEVEFVKALAKDPEVIHMEAKTAWDKGDRALHDKLLHIGWLQNRNKKGL